MGVSEYSCYVKLLRHCNYITKLKIQKVDKILTLTSYFSFFAKTAPIFLNMSFKGRKIVSIMGETMVVFTFLHLIASSEFEALVH